LNHQYQISRDITYHDKAKKYIRHYIKHHPDLESETSKFTWYDHAMAFRTLHILQTIAIELELAKPDINFITAAFEHISLNVENMLDSKNYSAHNHALMMDRTLLYLA